MPVTLASSSNKIALALAVILLAGCASSPSSTKLRRGQIIRSNADCAVCCEPAGAAAPTTNYASTIAATPVEPAPVTPIIGDLPAAPTPFVPPPLPAAEPSAEPPAPVAGLVAKRSDATVNLSWTLPESASGYRAVEIMRNSRESAAGRSRVRAVRATVSELQDTLPDAGADYWYWLKVTHADGTVQNFGPYAAPFQN